MEMKKRKLKEYVVKYRDKESKNGPVFETGATAYDANEARRYVREDLFECHTIVSVKLADPQIS